MKPQELRGRCNSHNLMNVMKKAYHNSKIYKDRTKRWHDKRIKKKDFTPEIRYYFLILGLNYSGTENFGANGKDHSR